MGFEPTTPVECVWWIRQFEFEALVLLIIGCAVSISLLTLWFAAMICYLRPRKRGGVDSASPATSGRVNEAITRAMNGNEGFRSRS